MSFTQQDILKKVCLCIFVLCSISFSADVKISPTKALIVDGKPFFPIAVWLQPAKNIDFLCSLGIDTFIPAEYDDVPDIKTYLDKLKDKNAYGIVHISNYSDVIKNHPALIAWMHPDEPDIAGGKPLKAPQMPPEKVISDYKLIKSKDPSKPVYVNFGSDQARGRAPIPNKMYYEFVKGADIISYDIYPINADGDNMLHLVGKGMDKIRKYCDDKKPCWIWLECSRIRDRRAPTPSELNTEVWMSIVHGAKGIGYFPHTWNPSYKACDIPKDVQDEMRKVNSKIKSMTEVLLSEDAKREVKCETGGDGKVDILVKELKDKIYIFAVNMKKNADKAKISITGLNEGDVVVQDEGRKIKMKGGEFEDNFKEYEVHIYEINK